MKKCPLWNRLDPLFAARPANIPPFAVDNTDDPNAAMQFLMAHTMPDYADEREELIEKEPAAVLSETDGNHVRAGSSGQGNKLAVERRPRERKTTAGEEKSRNRALQKLDANWTDSSEEEREGSRRGKGKKRETAVSLADDIMLALEKSKTARLKEYQEVQKKKLELKEQKQEQDYELAKEGLAIKRMEAENKRLMIQQRMANLGMGDDFQVKNNVFYKLNFAIAF